MKQNVISIQMLFMMELSASLSVDYLVSHIQYIRIISISTILCSIQCLDYASRSMAVCAYESNDTGDIIRVQVFVCFFGLTYSPVSKQSLNMLLLLCCCHSNMQN